MFRDNRFRDLRFAVHYMYANKGTVTGNASAGNHVGYALMYSAGLTVEGNRSDGDRDHGLLLNYANGARIEGNAVVAGGEKCVFIYNSTKNVFRGNWFEGCQIGIHLTAGSERNAISGNAFLGNRTQVKYVGTRYQEWSAAGRGNYWSDNPAFDLNGDGVADVPYRPNDLIDQVVWSHPGQAAAEQPGGADGALRAGPVPGAAAGWSSTARRLMAPPRCPPPWPQRTRRMSGLAFALRSVSKRYGALTALTAVSLDGLPGECLALVGHNGAGKTTLRSCCSAGAAERGHGATLDADPTSAAGDQARFQLGFLPETIAFDAAMTGREVLAFYARLKRLAPSAAEPLLERVGLAAAAGHRVGTYLRACGSGWAWPRRCSAGRGCCCSTSRPRAWTRRCAARSTS